MLVTFRYKALIGSSLRARTLPAQSLFRNVFETAQSFDLTDLPRAASAGLSLLNPTKTVTPHRCTLISKQALIRRQKIRLVLRPTQTYLNLMKPPGMSKALEALRCARVASKGMRESKGPPDFLVAWSSFLSEFQTKYTMMYAVIDEKEGKEAHWKKRVKIDRETDPVLNWLTAARHVASHVAAFQIQKIIGPSKLSISLIPENSQNLADARELFAVIAPTMITPNSLPPWIKGSKVMVDPPEYHFGKSLKSDLNCNQLWDITDLALNYTPST